MKESFKTVREEKFVAFRMTLEEKRGKLLEEEYFAVPKCLNEEIFEKYTSSKKVLYIKISDVTRQQFQLLGGAGKRKRRKYNKKTKKKSKYKRKTMKNRKSKRKMRRTRKNIKSKRRTEKNNYKKRKTNKKTRTMA